MIILDLVDLLDLVDQEKKLFQVGSKGFYQAQRSLFELYFLPRLEFELIVLIGPIPSQQSFSPHICSLLVLGYRVLLLKVCLISLKEKQYL